MEGARILTEGRKGSLTTMSPVCVGKKLVDIRGCTWVIFHFSFSVNQIHAPCPHYPQPCVSVFVCAHVVLDASSGKYRKKNDQLEASLEWRGRSFDQL